jgi:hypothetical protein
MGELRELRWADIDFPASIIVVRIGSSFGRALDNERQARAERPARRRAAAAGTVRDAPLALDCFASAHRKLMFRPADREDCESTGQLGVNVSPECAVVGLAHLTMSPA